MWKWLHRIYYPTLSWPPPPPPLPHLLLLISYQPITLFTHSYLLCLNTAAFHGELASKGLIPADKPLRSLSGVNSVLFKQRTVCESVKFLYPYLHSFLPTACDGLHFLFLSYLLPTHKLKAVRRSPHRKELTTLLLTRWCLSPPTAVLAEQRLCYCVGGAL